MHSKVLTDMPFLLFAGCGLFSYGILVTAGLIFLTSGLQNGMNAYILPVAKCDFHLSSAQMGALNAFFLAGGCCLRKCKACRSSRPLRQVAISLPRPDLTVLSLREKQLSRMIELPLLYVSYK